uniref:Uncharacterized protein n=1 Tax=Grammatophora oceanica TaxID=210454 RepID=A0A7S1Y4S9_9STRA
MEDDATVAGCSVATECVGRGQTVIGIDTTTSKLEQSPDRSASVFARSCVALHLAGVLLWLSAAGTGSLTLWVLQDATSSTLDGLSIHARTTWISLIMGVAVGLFFPFYGGIVNLISKTVFVGTYRPGNIEFDSRGLVQYWAAMAISMLKDDSVRVHLGGTFLENLYYAMMGARIGANVFLDSVYFFEPNLVTIGSNTSIGLSTTLAPHQVTRNAVELAQLNVGDRCTTGVNAVLHGRDLLQDDSTLSGKSMGLIGTRMKGAYSGYPARRTGVAFQPKRPSLPAWYILLTHPVSALWGSFWWIILSVRGRLCFRKLSFEKGGSNSRPDYPSHFCGQYNSCDGPPFSIRLDCGCWTSNLRLLVLKAGSYVEADESFRGHALCRFVSYSLSFSDDKLTAAEGRLSFGWWHVPESIVCLRLWREEDDWMAGHSWFMGDPHETVRFRPSRTTLSDA